MKMIGKVVIFAVALVHVMLVALAMPFLVGYVFARELIRMPEVWGE